MPEISPQELQEQEYDTNSDNKVNQLFEKISQILDKEKKKNIENKNSILEIKSKKDEVITKTKKILLALKNFNENKNFTIIIDNGINNVNSNLYDIDSVIDSNSMSAFSGLNINENIISDINIRIKNKSNIFIENIQKIIFCFNRPNDFHQLYPRNLEIIRSSLNQYNLFIDNTYQTYFTNDGSLRDDKKEKIDYIIPSLIRSSSKLQFDVKFFNYNWTENFDDDGDDGDDRRHNNLINTYKKISSKENQDKQNNKIINYLNLILSLIKNYSEHTVSEEEKLTAEDIYSKLSPTQTNPKYKKNLEKNYQKIIENFNKSKFSKEITLLENYKQLVINKLSQKNMRNTENAICDFLLEKIDGKSGSSCLTIVGGDLILNKYNSYYNNTIREESIYRISKDIESLIPNIIEKNPVIKDILSDTFEWDNKYEDTPQKNIKVNKKISRDNDGNLTEESAKIYSNFSFSNKEIINLNNKEFIEENDAINIFNEKIKFKSKDYSAKNFYNEVCQYVYFIF